MDAISRKSLGWALALCGVACAGGLVLGLTSWDPPQYAGRINLVTGLVLLMCGLVWARVALDLTKGELPSAKWHLWTMALTVAVFLLLALSGLLDRAHVRATRVGELGYQVAILTAALAIIINVRFALLRPLDRVPPEA